MPDISRQDAKHLVDDQGQADHSGYAMGIFLALVFSVIALLTVISLDYRVYESEEDIWKAMRSCPPEYTKVLNNDGSMKECVLTERLATPVAR